MGVGAWVTHILLLACFGLPAISGWAATVLVGLY